MIDPVSQCERFLQDYCRAFGNIGAWAQHPPRHSLCFGIVRTLFEADYKIEDLEIILQGMFAEKIKPKSYPYLLKIVKDRIEDLAHERATRPEPAS